MNTYTIKKKENGEIILLNRDNIQVPLTSILDLVYPKCVLAFDGTMGAGKTTFIKQLCSELGTNDIVNSPTFAIVNVYEVGSMKEEVYHFDCYRLRDIREAQDFGAEEYLYSGHLCFVEWPEKILPLLPENTVWLKIEELANGDRQLTIKNEC